MTVERLNVIITAQTEDFQQKIEEVNKALEKTAALAESSANSIASINVENNNNNTPYAARYKNTVDVSGITKEDFGRAADTFNAIEVAPTQSEGGIMGAAASVLSLRRGETLIGAVSEGGNQTSSFSRPIEIFTTVELDGEKVGESVVHYNNSRSRITNGFN